MSNVVRFPDMGRIEEQACHWIARLDSGNITDKEALELHDWLRQEPRHGQVLMETAELLDGMTALSKVSCLFPLEEQAMCRRSRDPAGGIGIANHARRLAGALTALAILVIAIWNAPFLERQEPAAPTMFSTGVGELKIVMLPDGSRVTLNTSSRIDVQFDMQQRRVLLTRGEALFDVAHDSAWPFLVEAGGSIIRAVGTAFNVHRVKGRVEVTVTDGVVEIATNAPERQKQASDPTGTTAQPASPHLTRAIAGQVVIIEMETEILQPIDTDTAAIEAKLAWQRGELIFDGEPLETVVAEVSRYTNQSLVITDEKIRYIPIGGHFAVGDVENLLDILEHGFNIQATRTGTGLVYLAGREDRNR